jgi:Domain of unknown function (DUF4276)
MAAIGLIVKGEYDKAAIPILARACRPNARFVPRECRGPVLGKIPGLVENLSHHRPRIEKILIVSDAHGRDPRELERKFTSRIVKKYSFPVIPIIIVEELEAWLIADSEALKRIIGVGRTFTNPERLPDPKSALEKLLARGTLYTSEMAGAIAREINLDRLEQQCPRFSLFKKAVRDAKYRP